MNIKMNYPKHILEDGSEIRYKDYIYSDIYLKLFNTFYLRNGCTCLYVTRPRPVYESIYDADGDAL